MILIIVGIGIAVAFLVWLWKVPIQNLVTSMEEGGSHPAEAYLIVFFVFAVVGLAIYAIWQIV